MFEVALNISFIFFFSKNIVIGSPKSRNKRVKHDYFFINIYTAILD